MPRGRRGKMRGRRGRRRAGGSSGEESDEEKDPLKSVAALVTSPSMATRVEHVQGICTEIVSFWKEEPPTEAQFSNAQMIVLFRARHPCFDDFHKHRIPVACTPL